MPFAATWMNLESLVLREVSQSKINIIRYHLYAESQKKKKGYKRTSLQNRNRVIDLENKFMVTKGDRLEEGWTGGVEMAHAHRGTCSDWPTGTCCLAPGTPPNTL